MMRPWCVTMSLTATEHQNFVKWSVVQRVSLSKERGLSYVSSLQLFSSSLLKQFGEGWWATRTSTHLILWCCMMKSVTKTLCSHDLRANRTIMRSIRRNWRIIMTGVTSNALIWYPNTCSRICVLRFRGSMLSGTFILFASNSNPAWNFSVFKDEGREPGLFQIKKPIDMETWYIAHFMDTLKR